ncbi:MAG: V-type ATPase subunit [Oscillospiraceae bacterium]|jgi:V/A-type H+-transporting ATPase subunit C|nr:V-type ATPase subunit [Oscillospiraceae bacterium]
MKTLAELSLNATVAKIRAVYGKRILNEQYRDMLGCKNVCDIAEYLKRNTHYAQALAGLDTLTVHRGLLEEILQNCVLEMYYGFCAFQELNKKPFYRFHIVWLEIVQILNMILRLKANTAGDYIVSLPASLLHMASFDIVSAARAKTFKELSDSLKGTDYYTVLSKLDSHSDFTQCERNLRTYYLNWLMNTAKESFTDGVRDELLLQIKTQVDLINIINAYRLKSVFNADVKTVKENMLPFDGRISKRKSDELVNAQSVSVFLKVLSETVYGKQLPGIAQLNITDGGMSAGENGEIFPASAQSVEFERQLYKLRYNLARRALEFSTHAAVSLHAVTYLFETELKNITRIIEGIRYGKSVSYIEKMLITSDG